MSDSNNQPLQNAYLLDWWLVLGRNLSDHSRGRGVVTIPRWIAELTELDDYVRVEPDDDTDGQYILQPSTESYGEATSTTGRHDSSVLIPFSEATVSRLPFEIGEQIALEIDLRTPTEGVVLREFDDFDSRKAHSLSRAVATDACTKWQDEAE